MFLTVTFRAVVNLLFFVRKIRIFIVDYYPKSWKEENSPENLFATSNENVNCSLGCSNDETVVNYFQEFKISIEN